VEGARVSVVLRHDVNLMRRHDAWCNLQAALYWKMGEALGGVQYAGLVWHGVSYYLERKMQDGEAKGQRLTCTYVGHRHSSSKKDGQGLCVSAKASSCGENGSRRPTANHLQPPCHCINMKLALPGGIKNGNSKA